MTNNLIKIIISTSFILAVGFIFLLQPTQAADPVQFKPQITIDGQFKAGQAITVSNSTKTIAEYVRAIYKYAIASVGILAVVVMMVGGFLWITAGGNQTQIGNAKSYIAASLTGLLLVMFSYIILKTVNPALVDLKTSTIQKPQEIPLESTYYCCRTAEGVDVSTCLAVSENEADTTCDGGQKFPSLDACQKESSCATRFCCHTDTQFSGNTSCVSVTLNDTSNCNVGNPPLYYPTLEECNQRTIGCTNY